MTLTAATRILFSRGWRFSMKIAGSATLPVKNDMFWIKRQEAPHIAALLEREGAKAGLLTIAIENRYVEHGDVETLRKVLGIDADTITQRICEEL